VASFDTMPSSSWAAQAGKKAAASPNELFAELQLICRVDAEKPLQLDPALSEGNFAQVFAIEMQNVEGIED
jgi:hypothetical protein